MILIDDILKLFPGRKEESFGKDYLTAKGEKILSSWPLPFVVCNQDFSIRAANAPFARFFKIPPTKLKGQTLFQILGNKGTSLIANGKEYSQITSLGTPSLSTLVGDRNPKILQGEFPRIGKKVLHVFTRRFPPNILLLFQDVTDEKELKEKIEKSRHELLSVFDGIDDPMVMIDKNFRIRRVNEAMLKALGASSYKPFIGKACYFKLHGRREKCPECTADKTFTTGKKNSRFGLLEAQPHADEVGYQITCYPLKDSSGGITGIAESYRDVSEVRKTEEELYESERSRIMEPLAAGIAHEVRNPLAIIQSTAQYCLGELGQENGDLQESLQTIVKNTEQANRVISNLLDFARPSQTDFKVQPLGPLVQKALSLVKTRAVSQKVRLLLKIERHLPPLCLDENRFIQAMMNFLVNSLDAMPRGGRLEIETRRQNANRPATPKGHNRRNRLALIVIRDSGRGIPEEILPKILQPFYSTKQDGVGLGLSIAEGIIRSHEGNVQFKSWLGKGTEVKITLPLRHRRNGQNDGNHSRH